MLNYNNYNFFEYIVTIWSCTVFQNDKLELVALVYTYLDYNLTQQKRIQVCRSPLSINGRPYLVFLFVFKISLLMLYSLMDLILYNLIYCIKRYKACK